MTIEKVKGKWRVHTTRLLEEVLSNNGMWALRIPLVTLDGLLKEVAARAIELDDRKMNELMMQLTLYSVADPYSPDHNQDIVSEFIGVANNVFDGDKS